MKRTTAIQNLLADTPRLWQGREPNYRQHTLTSGHARLDSRLPGGGWPVGVITELIAAEQGLGELSLLFPVLAQVSEHHQWLIMIDPPWVPYPSALHGHGIALEHLLLVRTGSNKESLWACEQALRSSQGGVVLAWPEQASFARLRRLQLAAEAGNKLAFLFRPGQAMTASSPAALRLYLEAGELGTRVDVVKCRGERSAEPVWIKRPPYLHMHPADSCLKLPADRLPAKPARVAPSLAAPGLLN